MNCNLVYFCKNVKRFFVDLKYKCCFPGCDYETDNRSLIEFHHTNLRELKRRMGKDVTIPLCPTHHKMIYHPEATSGQHAERTPDSMEVVMVTSTTHGKAVIFKDNSGKEYISNISVKPGFQIYYVKWDLINGITRGKANDIDLAVADRIDRHGYYQDGCTVYHKDNMVQVANDLLAAYMTNYMTQTKAEYQNILEKARNDWKTLQA